MFRKSLIILSAVVIGLFFISSNVEAQSMHKKMMKDSTKAKSQQMMKSDKSKECKDDCCSGSEKSGMKMEKDSTMHSGMKMDHSKMQHKDMKMDHSKMNMSDHSSDAKAENSTVKIWNKVCPVKGEEVDPEAPTVEYQGKTIGFCCPGCDKKFRAEPEKYMKNLSEDGTEFIGSK